jgi:dihydrofolate reductase
MAGYWSLIVAMTEDLVIGRDNGLPWKLPGDLKRFKELTTGKPVVMGRKTFDSIGRALPGRRNIVVTRDPAGFLAKHAGREWPASTTLEATSDVRGLLASHPADGENFLIGGGELFELGLPIARKVYVTWIHEKIEGDAFFPRWDSSLFRSSKVAEFQEPLRHSYVEYERA